MLRHLIEDRPAQSPVRSSSSRLSARWRLGYDAPMPTTLHRHQTVSEDGVLYPPQRPETDDPASERLDTAYHAGAQAEVDTALDIAAIRDALAQLPGSLSGDSIAERDER